MVLRFCLALKFIIMIKKNYFLVIFELFWYMFGLIIEEFQKIVTAIHAWKRKYKNYTLGCLSLNVKKLFVLMFEIPFRL